MDAVLSISTYLESSSWPRKTLNDLLPVVHAVVDPSRIPTHVPGGAARPPDVALIVLEALYLLGKTPVVGGSLQLWSRAWPWLRFLDKLGGCEQRLPRITLSLIHTLSVDGPTHDKIVLTPGALRSFGKSWVCVLDQPLDDLRSSVRTVKFLDHPQLRPDRSRLSELVGGLGGDEALAAVILHHLRHSARDGGPFTRDEMDNLAHLISFVGKFDCLIRGYDVDVFNPALPEPEAVASAVGLILLLNPPGRGVSLTKLGKALVRGGVVGLLCTLLRKFSLSFAIVTGLAVVKPGAACGLTLALLYFILTSCDGFTELPRAIEGHLLTSLIELSTSALRVQLLGVIQAHFEFYLPSVLVWHSVLSAVNPVWPDLLVLASCTVFRESTVFPQWEKLQSVITDRLRIFNRYNSSICSAIKMCANVDVSESRTAAPPCLTLAQCGLIAEKGHFRRCSGCQEMHYCSIACQRVDWRSGGHRTHCAQYRSRSDQQRVPGERCM